MGNTPANLWKAFRKRVSLGTGVLLAGVVGLGCSSDPYPRPTGYPRVEFPSRAYQRYSAPGCPFSFEYPVYGRLTEGSSVVVATDTGIARVPSSCAVDIYFPAFNAFWHITDRDFERDGATAVRSFEDYRAVVYKHSQKATHIQEQRHQWPAGTGTFFELWGAVPTSAQLYISDSLDNAVMASFYFKTAVKNDSLAPVIDFLKTDLLHLAETLRFESRDATLR